jgi:DNA repair protein SbcD/Mre11
LLHLADVHLERSFGRLGPERGSHRRQELRDTLQRGVALTTELGVDALCIAGDLYDTENVGPATGEFLARTFKALDPIPVLIAPGNRDPFRPGCLYDRVSWSPNVRVFRQATLQPEPIADGVVWGRAITTLEDRRSPLAGFHAPGDGPRVGLLHAEIVTPPATSTIAPLDPAEIAASGLQFLMLGHAHVGRVDGEKHYAYPGSLEPLDPDTTDDRWALLIEALATTTTLQRITLARRRVVVADVDLSDITSIDGFKRLVAERTPAWDGNDVRLRLFGTLRGELAQRQDAIAEALAPFDVDLTMAAQVATDFDALTGQHSTLGAYLRHVRSKMAEAANDAERRDWQDLLDAGIAAFTKGEVVLR